MISLAYSSAKRRGSASASRLDCCATTTSLSCSRFQLPRPPPSVQPVLASTLTVPSMPTSSVRNGTTLSRVERVPSKSNAATTEAAPAPVCSTPSVLSPLVIACTGYRRPVTSASARRPRGEPPAACRRPTMTLHPPATDAAPSPAPSSGARWRAHLRICRVDHWFKNVFVLPGIVVAIGVDAAHRRRRTSVRRVRARHGRRCASSRRATTSSTRCSTRRRTCSHPVKTRRPVPSGWSTSRSPTCSGSC